MIGWYWRLSQMCSNISVYIGSSSDSSPESITSISSLLISGSIIELSSYLSPLSASSRVLYNKPPSSNCESVIISPVFSLWRCSIRCIYYSQTHSHRFWKRLWRKYECTGKNCIKNNIIWRYYIPCIYYVHNPFNAV